jgi:hypothetical protein
VRPMIEEQAGQPDRAGVAGRGGDHAPPASLAPVPWFRAYPLIDSLAWVGYYRRS